MNETEEVEYSKAKLYKRWFSSIIDLMLMLLVGLIFFALSSFISTKFPSYISMVNERNEIQQKTSIYDSNGDLIILSVEKSSDTYDQKKTTLNNVIEEFYNDSTIFNSDVSYYSSYQDRKKEAKNNSGYNLFKLDESTNTYVEKNDILAEDYYNFYYKEISNYLVNDLSLNSRYKEITNTIVRISIICLVIGMTISFLIFFLLIPLLLKRGHQTIGMYLFKISYISVDALNLTYKQFFIRVLLEFLIGYVLSIFTFGVPLIVSITMMQLSKSGQDFFDYVTNTYVVDSSKKDVYLDYSEFTIRHDMSKNASIEDNDYHLTR